MKYCSCNSDSYWSWHAKVAKTYCFRCSAYVDSEVLGEPVEQEYRPLVMPEPVHLRHVIPWYNIPLTVSRKFKWYTTEFDGIPFLVLPVYRDSKMVFWTSRNLKSDDPKYISAPGVKKQYWLSGEDYPTKDLFICESIADAAYMSQIGQSVGLMGTKYDGSLDNWMKSARRIVIAFDGDAIGRVQGMVLARYLSDQKIGKKVLMLPTPIGKDPVDMQIQELEEVIRGLE